MQYLSAAECAQQWGLHLRAVQRRCQAGLVDGAHKIGNTWMIPSEACVPGMEPACDKCKEKASFIALPPVFCSAHANDYLLTLSNETERWAAKGFMAYHRCDYQQSIFCFEHIRSADIYYPYSLLYRALAGISTGNFSLYYQMQNQISLIEHNQGLSPELRLQLACMKANINASLLVTRQMPDWILRGDLAMFPLELCELAWYIYVKYLHATRAYSVMLTAAEARLSLPREPQHYSLGDVYLFLYAALGYQKKGFHAEARQRMLRAMELALPDGFISPFAETLTTMQGLTEKCLLEAFPSYYNQVVGQWKRIFPHWIRMHNECVERSVPAILTKREYQVALYAVDGLSNKEIAKAMFLSLSTVKNELSNVYAKIGVTKRSELKALII